MNALTTYLRISFLALVSALLLEYLLLLWLVPEYTVYQRLDADSLRWGIVALMALCVVSLLFSVPVMLRAGNAKQRIGEVVGYALIVAGAGFMLLSYYTGYDGSVQATEGETADMQGGDVVYEHRGPLARAVIPDFGLISVRLSEGKYAASKVLLQGREMTIAGDSQRVDGLLFRAQELGPAPDVIVADGDGKIVESHYIKVPGKESAAADKRSYFILGFVPYKFVISLDKDGSTEQFQLESWRGKRLINRGIVSRTQKFRSGALWLSIGAQRTWVKYLVSYRPYERIWQLCFGLGIATLLFSVLINRADLRTGRA